MIGADRHRLRGDADRHRGFSLMEMVVALGIFITVVTSVSGIFLLASRSQRKVFGMERAQSDSRYVLEAVARNVRTGLIDYARYAELTEPYLELALVDSTGQPMRFWRSGDADEQYCADAISRPCLLVSVAGNPPEAMTPRGVRILSARFYVSPKEDPWTFRSDLGGYASDLQPRVTFVMVTESLPPGRNETVNAGDRSILHVQTTVTSRGYRR